jgi:hypothetical protein
MTKSTETQPTAPARLKNTALSHLRGFSYHPSFCAHGLVRWLDRYDAARVRAEVERGKEVFPWINILRVWLSHDAWMYDRARFLANLRSEMALYRELGVGVMPVLFNGWHGVPDYGGLHPMHANLSAKPENMRRIFLDYVRDVFKACAPESETVRIWDLCNEPFLHYPPEEKSVRPGFLRILEAAAAELRDLGAKSPIGVGNLGKIEDEEDCLPFVDCLLSHRYFAYKVMKFDWYVYNVGTTVEFANKHNLPLVFGECAWGRWDDAERAESAPRDAEVMLAAGAGVTLYGLWECPLADLHGRDAGFTYDVDTPEDLCFIRRDGTPRPGNERMNEVMGK